MVNLCYRLFGAHLPALAANGYTIEIGINLNSRHYEVDSMRRLLALAALLSMMLGCKVAADAASVKADSASDSRTAAERALDDEKLDSEESINDDTTADGPRLGLAENDNPGDLVQQESEGVKGDAGTGNELTDLLDFLEKNLQAGDGTVAGIAVATWLSTADGETYLKEFLQEAEAAQPRNGEQPAEEQGELGLVEDIKAPSGPTSGSAGGNAATGRELSEQLTKVQRELDLLKQLIQKTTTHPLSAIGRTDPSQLPCFFEGAVSRGGQCQCRGWTRYVSGHIFAPTSMRTSLSNLGTSAPRECPRFETHYCHGWPTRGGTCGIYGKGAGFNVNSIASIAKIPGEAECYKSYDTAIQRATAAVFGTQSCGERIALLVRSGGKEEIEFWTYDTKTGASVTKVNRTPVNDIVTGRPIPTGVADLRRLCEQISVASNRAAWQAIGATESCRCGTRTIEYDEIIRLGSIDSFERSCLDTLSR